MNLIMFFSHQIFFNVKNKFTWRPYDLHVNLMESALCLCGLFYSSFGQDNPVGPIGSFVRTNLIGLPVIHNVETWIFEPDVAQRRKKQFIELHGDKAEKLIERLGLGIDGKADERLVQQRQRDEGHLGGSNAYLP